ncbi:YraN family protein [bacterium]|nr:YraN family protein [bacterium]
MKNVKSGLSRHLTTTGKGKQFEVLARQFLRKQGLKQFQLNFHSRFGEIDLIALDADVLVFIEVRYRKNTDHGAAAATVNFHKQQKIIRTAQHYLQKSGLTNKMPCRFDVIGISGSVDALEIQWIKNAF